MPCLEDDERWPEFAATAVAHGIRSTLSLPLLAGSRLLGALNFYTSEVAGFGDAETETGRLFATQAAVVAANAQAYWGEHLRSEDLQNALVGREVIDLAKGIIMHSTGCTPDEAFQKLVQQSQTGNRKLREVAADIVARAQRRRS